MQCPYCKVNLENKINYDNRDDHKMDCPDCKEEIEVTHDTYPDECDGREIDIFELHRRGES